MIVRQTSEILDHMAVLVDPLRSRILALLTSDELMVSDICSVLQLPQSTVSRHLKILAEKDWVASRPLGTKRLYRFLEDGVGDSAQRLWQLTYGEISNSPVGKEDRERLVSLLAQQRGRSNFFEARGENWDAMRGELFGHSFHLYALMGLLDDDWCVADLGCGSGLVAEAIAPFAKQVVGVDASSAMLQLAKNRLQRFDNVELRQADLSDLPIETATMDAATLILVLHHLERPEAAIEEAARALRPGAKLLIVDMKPHDRTQYRTEMGHVWLGFSEETLRDYLTKAGFMAIRYLGLPPTMEAKGPNLLAMTARKRP